jgi:hypothetical protein
MKWIQAGSLSAVLLMLVVNGCFPQSRNPMLTSNFSSFYLNDTERQAKAAGVDYRPTLEKALGKDAQALHTLFLLTSSGTLSGRGSDSHASMLWTLMVQWGDRKFSDELGRETPQTREEVLLFLDYAAACDYAKTYPRTHGLAPHSSRIKFR